jgi:hypothetical protein
VGYRLVDGLDLAIAVLTLIGGVFSAAAAWLAYLTVRRSDEVHPGDLDPSFPGQTKSETVLVVPQELVEALMLSLLQSVPRTRDLETKSRGTDPQQS